MSEKLIGKVNKYFAKIGVAALDLEGTLKTGDTVHFKGAHTDFNQTIDSMQVEHQSIPEAGPGAQVGIKVKDRVRPGDDVFVVTD